MEYHRYADFQKDKVQTIYFNLFSPLFSFAFLQPWTSLVTSAGALCPEDCKCVNLSIMLSPINAPLLHTTKDTHGGWGVTRLQSLAYYLADFFPLRGAPLPPLKEIHSAPKPLPE